MKPERSWWEPALSAVSSWILGPLPPADYTQLYAITLVTGDLNDVWAAQEGHFNLLDSGRVLKGALDVASPGTMPRGPVLMADWGYEDME